MNEPECKQMKVKSQLSWQLDFIVHYSKIYEVTHCVIHQHFKLWACMVSHIIKNGKTYVHKKSNVTSIEKGTNYIKNSSTKVKSKLPETCPVPKWASRWMPEKQFNFMGFGSFIIVYRLKRHNIILKLFPKPIMHRKKKNFLTRHKQ